MTLRVYRKLSFAMVPLAPALIKRRLKLGKEDPARVGERRGMSDDVRPHGPLVWIHGASVGEVLASAALIERLMAMTRGRPIVVASTSHPGEEEILAETHKTLAGFFPGLLTVIVPRHADRGEAVARTVEASGLHASLRSREQLPTAATDIYVADTMGELGLFYRLAPIVFMGGSLIEHGGQNPIEAVKLGASIVHGPHVFNFTDVYEALDAAGGARRADSQEALVKQLGQLLADPKAREASLAASERVVEQLGGALERTLTALEPYLLQLRLEMGAANA